MSAVLTQQLNHSAPASLLSSAAAAAASFTIATTGTASLSNKGSQAPSLFSTRPSIPQAGSTPTELPLRNFRESIKGETDRRQRLPAKLNNSCRSLWDARRRPIALPLQDVLGTSCLAKDESLAGKGLVLAQNLRPCVARLAARRRPSAKTSSRFFRRGLLTVPLRLLVPLPFKKTISARSRPQQKGIQGLPAAQDSDVTQEYRNVMPALVVVDHAACICLHLCHPNGAN